MQKIKTSNRLKAIHLGSLTGAVEKSYTYDDAGRLTQQAGINPKTLTWNQQDRAKTINANSKAITYGYDPLGYRISSNGSSRGQQDYYLEGEHLEAVYSNSLLQAQYLRGASTDELLAGWLQDSSNPANVPANANAGVSANTITGTPYIFHHDHQNSVSSISSHSGNTLQQASYSAFGNTLNQTGSAANNSTTNTLKYTGREQDADTNLYYYRARYYDTDIGRFISEDPLQFQAGINFYAYVENNPVNANDPSGMETIITGGNNKYSVIFNNVYFTGSGYTEKFANQYKSAIESRMTGTFPPSNIQLTTKINFAPNNKPVDGGLQVNVIPGNNVPVGKGKYAMGTTQLSYEIPYATVTLPAKTNSNVIVHEGFFHALCPSCQYSGHNEVGSGIMNAYSGVTQKITSGPIEEALSGIGKFNPVPTLQKMDFSSSFFGIDFLSSGASGGYLLYPNKPNNNQMQSVYSK